MPLCHWPRTYSVDQSTERYELHGKTQGFLVLNIRQDQYNSKTDNAEKMICDYFEPKSRIQSLSV